jgi:glucose dehydrogenase
VRTRVLIAAGLSSILVAGLGLQIGQGQTAAPPPGSDWPMYRHDLAGTGYSPLAQIDAQNVTRLAEAWRYSLQSDTPATGRGAAGANSEATPIVVGRTLYVPTANRIVALDADTGRLIWQHAVTGGAPSRRGVAYWPGDGTLPARIIFTIGRRLAALRASDGSPDPGFGKDGEVDLVVPYNSVPLVYRNVIIAGANTPATPSGAAGNARAYDARTGAKLWELHSVPLPGEIGHDTWEGDSWRDRSGANAWPFYFTLDEQRGLAYLPFASPAAGAYGGDRKGANLFGNSVVAVDVQTGAYKWHFQTIHHDIWDADPPAPPGLFDIRPTPNGPVIPALALTTKSGYMYILNRETGQPIFGVEERPVPKSDVPGELAFPTQPFPVKPPPIARNSYTSADLVTANDTSPEHVKACADLIERNGGVANAGPFTPWGFRTEGAPIKSTLLFPGGLGGANWGGTAFDPRSGFIFVATQDDGALGWVEKTKTGTPEPYDKASQDRNFDVRMPGGNWPCQKPPWGRLIAVNPATGDFAWQVPLGITEGLPETKQRTGRPAMAGPIATASGLLFIGSTDDNRFRALDLRNGRELWVTKLDRRGNADPITYLGANGKQYVAIVATDTLLVYALP